MDGGLGMDVAKSQAAVVFVNNVRGNFAIDDPLEDRLFSHRKSSFCESDTPPASVGKLPQRDRFVDQQHRDVVDDRIKIGRSARTRPAWIDSRTLRPARFLIFPAATAAFNFRSKASSATPSDCWSSGKQGWQVALGRTSSLRIRARRHRFRAVTNDREPFAAATVHRIPRHKRGWRKAVACAFHQPLSMSYITPARKGLSYKRLVTSMGGRVRDRRGALAVPHSLVNVSKTSGDS